MIHKFNLYDTNIVVDVYSGAVHVFDDVSFRVLDYYGSMPSDGIVERLSDKFDRAEILEAVSEIQKLEAAGQLFSKDDYKRLQNAMKGQDVVKSLCLHVSHDCNMRCKYCFAGTGSFGGGRKVMDAETGKKAVDFLIARSGSRKNLEIEFFGGEPLMNFDVVKQVTEYAKKKGEEISKNFRFTITTNALMLEDDTMNYINKNMDVLVLSIDGRESTNDNMRRLPDGSGTYQRILPKIKKIADLRKQENYYVRGTFTSENLDFSKDVLHLADEGLKQISIEPVVLPQDAKYAITHEDLPIIFSEYEKLAKEYVERKKTSLGFNFFHFMLELEEGPCAAKRILGCGSGSEYLAVTPDGDIYPCHQLVGIQEFKMGTVASTELSEDIRTKFKTANIYTRPACASCWARFYCAGGCAAGSYKLNGEITGVNKINCEIEKKRIECSLWIKTQSC